MLLCPPWITATIPLFTQVPDPGTAPAITIKRGYAYRPVFGDYDCGFLVDWRRLAFQVAVVALSTAVAVGMLARYKSGDSMSEARAEDDVR